MNKKEFYKSRTILIAFFAFVGTLLDYFFGFGIAQDIQSGAEQIFIPGEGDSVQKIDFLLLISLAYSIFMRIKTTKAVATKKQVEESQTLNKKEQAIKERVFEIPSNLRVPILMGLVKAVEEETELVKARRLKK